MPNEIDPVLEAVSALRSDGVDVTAAGEELELWRVGHFTFTDGDVMRLAHSRGLITDDGA